MAQAIPWQDRVIPEPNSGCLLWEGAVSRYGYGHIRRGGKDIVLHRMVWEEANGPIPDDLHVLHNCDVPACVNLNHLRLGTRSDNMTDIVVRGRHTSNRLGFLRNKTHCKQGHLYAEETIGLTARGHRYCRVCKDAYMRRYSAAKPKTVDPVRSARALGARKVVRNGRSCWAHPGDADYPA
jgi:hypothetical protein